MESPDACTNYKQKVNWVLTYGASGGYILFHMFNEEGSLNPDEVHSTSDGSIVYTYFHLQRKCSKSTVMKFMDKMHKEHGIVLSEIFGYDSVGSTDQADSGLLTNHIAFRMIYEHMKANKPAFISCTDGIPGVSRGLLMQYDGFSRIGDVLSSRNKKLVPFLENIEMELKHSKRKLDQETWHTELLREEVAAQSMKIERLEQCLKKRNAELNAVHLRNRDLEVKVLLDIHKITAEQDKMKHLEETLRIILTPRPLRVNFESERPIPHDDVPY